MTDTLSPYQHDLSHFEVEALCYGRISKRWLKHERMLMQSKWYDYRFMSPFDATLIYIAEFNKAYRQFYARTYDRKVASLLRVVEPKDLIENFEKNKAALVGCWRGRQYADSVCMPYDVYINIAMELRLAYWKQPFMPRPSALYSKLITDQIEEKWRNRQQARLHIGMHQNFRVHRYCELKAQNDHHEWLFEQANLRPAHLEFLARFIEEELLPEEKVRSRVGIENYQKLTSYFH